MVEYLCIHEGTKSDREERYHLVMKKLNLFEMFPSESANEMYSRLNVLKESQWAWTHTNTTLQCCEKDLECPPH